MQLEPFWLKMKIMTPGAKPYQKATHDPILDPDGIENAGYDIWSTKSGKLMPLTARVFTTGIATAFPIGWGALLVDRSGNGVKGFIRRAGLLDSGFRKEWQVCLFNSGPDELEIESVIENPNAKAMIQVIFIPCGHCVPEVVGELPPANRGENWQGSTDHARSTP